MNLDNNNINIKYAAVRFIFCSVFFILFNSNLYSFESDSLMYPYEYHGSILQDSTSNTIEKKDIQRVHYNSLYEITDDIIGIQGMYLGAIGHYNNFLNYGSLGEDRSLLYNGRSLINNSYGGLNSETFSPEFFERIEILKGSQSITLSPENRAITLNLQEIRYNTSTPFTRLWFAQGGGSFVAADGVYSQNFAKGWNLAFGFKQMSENTPFENQNMVMWNARGILRYSFDSNSSISLSEKFYNNKLSIRGGSNPFTSDDFYSPILSQNQFTLASREYRHDLDLTYTKNDKYYKITNVSYYVNGLNERNYDISQFQNDSILNSNNRYYQLGNKFSFDLDLKTLIIKSFADIGIFRYNRTDFFDEFSGTKWSLGGNAKINLTSELSASGGIKLKNNGRINLFSFGERVTYKGADFKLFLDHSLYEKSTPFQFEDILFETNNLLILGFSYNADFTLDIELFMRNVNNAILPSIEEYFVLKAESIGNYLSYGGEVKFKSLLLKGLFSKNDRIDYKISFNLNRITDNALLESIYPLFDINFMLKYQLLINKSELNLGISGRIQSSKSSMRFIPLSNSYTLNQDLETELQNNGLNAFAIMKLGNAFVKITFENLLDSDYFLTAFYPMRGRNLRLSVAWSFFD